MAKLYYVIESHDINQADETRHFTIQRVPGTTNMSNEEKRAGWLGTTGNVWEYAHGAFPTHAKAVAFIEQKMPGAEQLPNDEYDESGDTWGYTEESIWTADDWLGNSSLDDLDINTHSTDAEVRAAAQQIEADAVEEGVHITDDVEDYLHQRIAEEAKT